MRWPIYSMSLLSFALAGCGGCDEQSKLDIEGQRLWGREKIDKEAEIRAKKPIDARQLADNPVVRAQVLTMGFEELVARFGFLSYDGRATFDLGRDDKLSLVEQTKIDHGRHGSFRVRQIDGKGTLTREVVYNNGVLYGRLGKGKMRVLGAPRNKHHKVRDEGWQPLRVYTAYFGPRAGLVEAGTDSVAGRSAIKYDFVLLDGSELITVEGIKGAKRPVSLSGSLWVDEASGAPIKADMKGVLELPTTSSERAPGKLALTLKFTVKERPADEIVPGEFVPTITGREVDLDPLAFLDGGTRTSTVIGGKKSKKAK